jgi:hypothetical protein
MALNRYSDKCDWSCVVVWVATWALMGLGYVSNTLCWVPGLLPCVGSPLPPPFLVLLLSSLLLSKYNFVENRVSTHSTSFTLALSAILKHPFIQFPYLSIYFNDLFSSSWGQPHNVSLPVPPQITISRFVPNFISLTEDFGTWAHYVCVLW